MPRARLPPATSSPTASLQWACRTFGQLGQLSQPHWALPAGYHNGVARNNPNATDVDHDVEIVGWGETADGLKYW